MSNDLCDTCKPQLKFYVRFIGSSCRSVSAAEFELEGVWYGQEHRNRAARRTFGAYQWFENFFCPPLLWPPVTPALPYKKYFSG
jgi:hypothetical protein